MAPVLEVKDQSNKRLREDESKVVKETETNDDSDVEIVKVIPAPQKKKPSIQPRHPSCVYIVMSCDYPFHNDKWGENSGHDTQDTEIHGVFANLRDANRYAKEEWLEYEGEDADSDDNGDELFYQQEESPEGWKAHHVWVEKQTVQY